MEDTEWKTSGLTQGCRIFSFFRAPLNFDNYNETTALHILPSLLPHSFCFIDIQLSCSISNLQLGWFVFLDGCICVWLENLVMMSQTHASRVQPHLTFVLGTCWEN